MMRAGDSGRGQRGGLVSLRLCRLPVSGTGGDRCLLVESNPADFDGHYAVSYIELKPHMEVLIKEILFPLMCHSDCDEEQWEADPIGYIRDKCDVHEMVFSPAEAAQIVLYEAAAKRSKVLQNKRAVINLYRKHLSIVSSVKSGLGEH